MTPLGRTFTTADAIAAGIAPHQLSGRRFQRLFRGGYAPEGIIVTDRERIELALRLAPAAEFVSHHTAALLLGGIVPPTSDVHLGTRRRSQVTSVGIRLHHFTHRPALILLGGLTLTSVEQTFLNLARTLELTDLLVLGDSLVRKGRTTRQQLQRFCREASPDGVGRAREAASLVRPWVDSPNESRLRLLIVTAGLPEPTVNLHIQDRNGVVVRRIDLAYADCKVAVEYDGRQHIAREAQWRADLARREQLESEGWRFVVVTSADLFSAPDRVVERVHRALTLSGMKVPSPTNGWQRHFRGPTGE